MAYSRTLTLIPLARVADILSIDPYHFHQIETTARPFVPSCPDDWYQFDYQASGKLSRESLSLALRQAEDVTIQQLMWSPLPRWYEEEHTIEDYYKPEVISYLNSHGKAKSVTANYGHIVDVGQRVSTFVATPNTVIDDGDGDGFNERVTITFATTVTTADELHVYYPSKSGRSEWEIRPLTSISIAAGIATIRFPKYLIALEVLLERPRDPNNPHIGVDGDDDTNFLTTVDVYRVYSDPSKQVDFYYEDDSDCSSGDCVPSTNTGCLQIRDRRLGILAYERADYSATTGAYTTTTFTSKPDKMKIYYRAGWRDINQEYPNLRMDQTLERLIVYYALCLIDTKMNGCANTMNIWEQQTVDLALRDGGKGYAMPWGLMDNPIGTQRAAILLWKHIQPLRLAKTPQA